MSFCLNPGEVHIWKVKISPFIEPVYATNILSEEEWFRFKAFSCFKTRVLFLHARIGLRILLGPYLSLEPRFLKFQNNKYGKPSLILSDQSRHSGIYFNISHSHTCCLYAFTHFKGVGIDVEYIKNELDIEDLADMVFSPYEKTYFLSLSLPEKIKYFYSTWTQKEAVLKGIGCGLLIPPCKLQFSLEKNRNAHHPNGVIVNGKLSKWRVYNLPGIDDYSAAVAIKGNPDLIKTYTIDSDQLLLRLNH